MQIKTEYVKKIHADNARWRIKRRLMETKLCPIFEKHCKGDECMSFDKGRTYASVKYTDKGIVINIYKITIPLCCNAIVNGYIEAEMTNP